MEAQAADRRAFERFNARYPTRYKDSRNDFGTDVALRDASAEGARLFSREKLALNDFVDLEVKLPDSSDPLNLSGQVVWVKGVESQIWDVGIKFSEINFMRLARLYKFV